MLFGLVASCEDFTLTQGAQDFRPGQQIQQILLSWSKLGSGQYLFVSMVGMVGKIPELFFPTNEVCPLSSLAIIDIISQELIILEETGV